MMSRRQWLRVALGGLGANAILPMQLRLNLPTGGGKTLIGAYAVHIVSEKFLQTTTPTVLWLAPSNAIVS